MDLTSTRFEAMPLIGIGVHNFDAEVLRYSEMFGLTFNVFTAGVDYELRYAPDAGTDTATPLTGNVRIAMDTRDTFELVELADAPEGFRSVHVRVDDIDAVAAHFVEQGLVIAQQIWVGTGREIVLDGGGLNGIRLVLVQFEGESFSQALAASPAAAVA